jgi:hypothetical protein
LQFFITNFPQTGPARSTHTVVVGHGGKGHKAGSAIVFVHTGTSTGVGSWADDVFCEKGARHHTYYVLCGTVLSGLHTVPTERSSKNPKR